MNIPMPEKFEMTDYDKLNRDSLNAWIISKRAKKDCPHCEGIGFTAQPNGEDDFDLEICTCTYGK